VRQWLWLQKLVFTEAIQNSAGLTACRVLLCQVHSPLLAKLMQQWKLLKQAGLAALLL
jgi:hypothetical protein